MLWWTSLYSELGASAITDKVCVSQVGDIHPVQLSALSKYTFLKEPLPHSARFSPQTGPRPKNGVV